MMTRKDFYCLTFQQQIYNTQYWLFSELCKDRLSIPETIFFDNLIKNATPENIVEIAELIGYIYD